MDRSSTPRRGRAKQAQQSGHPITREDYKAALRRAETATRAWCLDKHITPHRRLYEAFAFTLASLARRSTNNSSPDPADLQHDGDPLDGMRNSLSEQNRAELDAACDQVRQFIASYPDAEAFARAMRSWGLI
jgi:hypothetical protein